MLRRLLEREGVGEDQQDMILSMIDRGMLKQAFDYMRWLGASRDAVDAIRELVGLSGSSAEIFRRAEEIFHYGRSPARNLLKRDPSTSCDRRARY